MSNCTDAKLLEELHNHAQFKLITYNDAEILGIHALVFPILIMHLKLTITLSFIVQEIYILFAIAIILTTLTQMSKL